MTWGDTLSGWTGPSSATEQEKQLGTERASREAVEQHKPFEGCNLRVHGRLLRIGARES